MKKNLSQQVTRKPEHNFKFLSYTNVWDKNQFRFVVPPPPDYIVPTCTKEVGRALGRRPRSRANSASSYPYRLQQHCRFRVGRHRQTKQFQHITIQSQHNFKFGWTFFQTVTAGFIRCYCD